jgi:hypothetical protein
MAMEKIIALGNWKGALVGNWAKTGVASPSAADDGRWGLDSGVKNAIN